MPTNNLSWLVICLTWGAVLLCVLPAHAGGPSTRRGRHFPWLFRERDFKPVRSFFRDRSSTGCPGLTAEQQAYFEELLTGALNRKRHAQQSQSSERTEEARTPRRDAPSTEIQSWLVFWEETKKRKRRARSSPSPKGTPRLHDHYQHGAYDYVCDQLAPRPLPAGPSLRPAGKRPRTQAATFYLLIQGGSGRMHSVAFGSFQLRYEAKDKPPLYTIRSGNNQDRIRLQTDTSFNGTIQLLLDDKEHTTFPHNDAVSKHCKSKLWKKKTELDGKVTKLSKSWNLQRQGSNVAVTVLLKDNNASTVWETKFLLIKSDNLLEPEWLKADLFVGHQY